MGLIPRLRAVLDRVIGLSVLLGAAGLLVALGTIAVDVVGRFFGHPLYGARDIVQMAGVFVVFGGMAYAHQQGAHITVDLLESRFSPAMNRILLIAGNLAGAVVFGLIAWQLWKAVALAQMLRQSTNLLYIPRAPFLYAMTGFSVLTLMSMLLAALDLALGRTDGRRPA